MTCIQISIADHFKVLFRDMTDQALDEIHGKDGFLDIFIIFMAVVVESDHIAIIVIDFGGSNDWSAGNERRF